jgi:hypothetical protein
MSRGRSPYAHSDVRMKEQEARKAQQRADALACEAWNERLAKLGGPLRPSPTLRAAISGGYGFLRVECNGCQQQAWIDLAKVRRPPDTWIWQLEGALACQLCRERSKFPPRSRIQMLCERHGQLGALRHEDRD